MFRSRALDVKIRSVARTCRTGARPPSFLTPVALFKFVPLVGAHQFPGGTLPQLLGTHPSVMPHQRPELLERLEGPGEASRYRPHACCDQPVRLARAGRSWIGSDCFARIQAQVASVSMRRLSTMRGKRRLPAS
jgi:hypothetical protein